MEVVVKIGQNQQVHNLLKSNKISNIPKMNIKQLNFDS